MIIKQMWVEERCGACGIYEKRKDAYKLLGGKLGRKKTLEIHR
jgi:hypothetical protein